MSKKVLTVEFSKDFLGFEVSLWGLITGDDLRFLSDDMECACNTFFREQPFSVLINAFGCTLYDDAAIELFETSLQVLEKDARVMKVAILYYDADAPCEVPESVPVFVDKELASAWLCD